MTPWAPGQSGARASNDTGFGSGLGHPFDVENDPSVDVLGPTGDEDPFGAPRGLAGALEVQPGIMLSPDRAEFAGLLVELGVTRVSFEQWRHDLAVSMDHPRQVRVGPGPRPLSIEEADLAGLLGGGPLAMESAKPVEDLGPGEPRSPPVEVMVASHRLGRQPLVGVVGELRGDELTEMRPHDGMGEFGVDFACGAVDRHEGVEKDPHERRVVARPPTRCRVDDRDGVGERVQLGVGDERGEAIKGADPGAQRLRSGRGHRTPTTASQ
jgi:hypothetical protein